MHFFYGYQWFAYKLFIINTSYFKIQKCFILPYNSYLKIMVVPHHLKCACFFFYGYWWFACELFRINTSYFNFQNVIIQKCFILSSNLYLKIMFVPRMSKPVTACICYYVVGESYRYIFTVYVGGGKNELVFGASTVFSI